MPSHTAEYNRTYFKKRRDIDPEFKERTNKFAKEWWDRNKDMMNEKRRLRYQNDPEYKTKVRNRILLRRRLARGRI